MGLSQTRNIRIAKARRVQQERVLKEQRRQRDNKFLIDMYAEETFPLRADPADKPHNTDDPDPDFTWPVAIFAALFLCGIIYGIFL